MSSVVPSKSHMGSSQPPNPMYRKPTVPRRKNATVTPMCRLTDARRDCSLVSAIAWATDSEASVARYLKFLLRPLMIASISVSFSVSSLAAASTDVSTPASPSSSLRTCASCLAALWDTAL